MRGKAYFPKKIAGEIRPCITAKGRNKRQPNQQLPVVKFSYEIDMRKQEAGIEKAKEGCTAFHIACFSVAKHAVNQQSKHKQRGKHAEQRLCIHKLIHENYIKQAEQICNDMCALYLTWQSHD